MKTDFKWVVSDTSASQSMNSPRHEVSLHKDVRKKHGSLVYGLQGLAEFLHVSTTTAWRLKKSHKYDAAIYQNGRCIITDTDKLLELMQLDQSTETNELYSNYFNNVY